MGETRGRSVWSAEREAVQIAELIRGGAPDRRVIHKPRGTTVVAARIIPGSSRDAAELRRERFFAALDELLADGWRRFGATYKPL